MIERYRVYLRSISDGSIVTTTVTKNPLSVDPNQNPLDVREAAEAKLGNKYTAFKHHRIRHDQR